MTIQLKLIIAACVLLAGFALAWYVQSLRADNERLNQELAQAQAVVAAQSANLAVMQSASQINAAAQSKASRTINAMNAELSAVRRQDAQRQDAQRQGVTNETETDNPVAGLVAMQLNRLFDPAAHSH